VRRSRALDASSRARNTKGPNLSLAAQQAAQSNGVTHQGITVITKRLWYEAIVVRVDGGRVEYSVNKEHPSFLVYLIPAWQPTGDVVPAFQKIHSWANIGQVRKCKKLTSTVAVETPS
jgi:hypothetical protein